MLIGQFYGTSAAEGIPAPFCRCAVCEQAREKKGVYQRMRTCFRLSEKIMIDMGADAVSQCMRWGDVNEVEHVLITHTHEDHLNPHMLMEAMWAKKYRSAPLHYYFTDKAFDIVVHWRQSDWIIKGMVPRFEREGVAAFHQLRYGERVEIDGIGVTPLRGNHPGNVKENTALYLLELPDGRTLFYGLDTGPYFPETVEALKKYRVDIFISEATRGLQPRAAGHTHLTLEEACETAQMLYDQGTLHEKSVIYLTHINHSTGHDEMVKAAAQLPFPVKTTVAYDGLKIF